MIPFGKRRARARGHGPHGRDLRRPRAALAGGGPPGGGGGPLARDPRPAVARPLRLGGDRRERQEDGQGARRATRTAGPWATGRRSRPASGTSSSSTSTRPCGASAPSTPSWATTRPWRTPSCPRCGTSSTAMRDARESVLSGRDSHQQARTGGTFTVPDVPASAEPIELVMASTSPPGRSGPRSGPRRPARASRPRGCRSPRGRSCGAASPA